MMCNLIYSILILVSFFTLCFFLQQINECSIYSSQGKNVMVLIENKKFHKIQLSTFLIYKNMRKQSRKRLDNLFLAHMISAVGVGLICLLAPRLFLWFLHEEMAINLPGYEVAETIIRLYGSLIFAQAMLVKNTRESSDPKLRKSFVQAYAVAFGLTSISLGYAQAIGHFSKYNWINILFFMSLCLCYSYL